MSPLEMVVSFVVVSPSEVVVSFLVVSPSEAVLSVVMAPSEHLQLGFEYCIGKFLPVSVVLPSTDYQSYV